MLRPSTSPHVALIPSQGFSSVSEHWRRGFRLRHTALSVCLPPECLGLAAKLRAEPWLCHGNLWTWFWTLPKTIDQIQKNTISPLSFFLSPLLLSLFLLLSLMVCIFSLILCFFFLLHFLHKPVSGTLWSFWSWEQPVSLKLYLLVTFFCSALVPLSSTQHLCNRRTVMIHLLSTRISLCHLKESV